MLVRVVLFLGIGLVVLAGGAMGWQYWQGLPSTAEVSEQAPAEGAELSGPQLVQLGDLVKSDQPTQNWLISQGGGLVPRDAVKVYLQQDRFQEHRSAQIVFRAPLAALLSEGEALPGAAFVAVFADIRAKALATHLCEPLVANWAAACAVVNTTVSDVDLSGSEPSAQFGFELSFALKSDATPLPDLSTRTLRRADIEFSAEMAGGAAGSPEGFLGAAIAAFGTACAQTDEHCRIARLSVVWDDPGNARASAELNWLAPLPAGMYPVPPLEAAADS